MKTMAEKLGGASDEIVANLVDNQNRMDVLVSRSRESINQRLRCCDEEEVRRFCGALFLNCDITSCL